MRRLHFVANGCDPNGSWRVVEAVPAGTAMASAGMTNQESHNQPLAAPILLCKRKDFLDTDEAAKSHPNRTYYYRKEADIEKVIDTCTKKLATNPSDAITIAIRGASHMKKMVEWAQAVDDFGQVLKLLPTDANARGLAWTNLNQLQEAIEDFTHALLLNPNHINAAYARASCYNKQGDFSRAIEDYHFALMKDQQGSNKSKQAAKPLANPVTPTPSSVMVKPIPVDKIQLSGPIPSLSVSRGVDSYTKLRERELLDSMTQLKYDDSKTSQVALTLCTWQCRMLRSNGSSANHATTASNNARDADTSHSKHCTDSKRFLTITYGSVAVPGLPINKCPSRSNVAPSARPPPIDITSEAEEPPLDSTKEPSVVGDPAEIHHARGFAFRREGRFDLAVAAYSEAIALNPRGISFDRRSGSYTGAVDDFSKAIQLIPSNADFYHNRGFCHRKQGRYDVAIQDYSAAIDLNPTHFKALYNRAFSYDKLEAFEAAIVDYTAAIQVDPKNANAYHNRGSTWEKMKNLHEAINDFTMALTLQPQAASTYNSRGLAYDQQGKHALALQDFHAANRLEPQNPIFLHNRGYCFRNMGEYDRAIADYTEALRLEPDNVAAYSNRGYARRKQGQYDGAVDDYTAALRLDPTSTRTLSNRAYSYAKMGCLAESIADYSRVIDLEGHNAYAYHNRAILHEKMGNLTLAKQDFMTAMALDNSSSTARC
ncbi:hypothetical protein DYB32_002490 [Aphanomyces invadans]|uniref:UDP-N-acetylglucosamine--peptide N-acetylglucosaminyltransferase SPINDLY n=1 Tax=Aphanomyces invadans TaxID=157072 RepID=A0A3R6Z7P5_9STRA|nr:hypothetical protein DYB32_002490 [Aphanomyces invadans]